ncbi:hypothetical protein M011DRAFT_460273 [Sporormia fimetaria CBS 119925]|uniref:Uncharacterized protein n=1 Tax=Sporormia fimetaria CBS 119925 TaxID=1340428 RepID=A0A6A6V5R8_9PLEO|nr:hypothetical protein M011DRAFT_460273 [Sporormia fimetaria CBS 119925]
MSRKLDEYAKKAKGAAVQLAMFETEIPDYASEITGIVAELYAIASALHLLDENPELSRKGKTTRRIERDLDIVLQSLTYTLETVGTLSNKSKRKRKQAPGAFPGTPQYAEMWVDMCADFEAEGATLLSRLELYRLNIWHLDDTLKGKESSEEMSKSRHRLAKLLRNQESDDESDEEHISSYFDKLHVGDLRYHHGMIDASIGCEDPKTKGIKEDKAKNHTLLHLSCCCTAPSRPAAPASDAPRGVHWATKIFDGHHGRSDFRDYGVPTKCLGRDEPNAIELFQQQKYQKVVEIPFEAADIWVRLYWRPEDNRARILFLALDEFGNRVRFSFSLANLRITRQGCCLQLCRVNRHDQGLDLWANLRFNMYERMVLFWCTFVALKRQDERGTAQELATDYFQPGEDEEFGGLVQEGKSIQAFRVWRDLDSGAVRFEVMPRRGRYTTVPIWTAFVTPYIGQEDWMKLVGKSTIQFKELHPYVFHQGYVVPRGKTGRYQVTFKDPEDALILMDVFHEIGL